MNGIIFFFSVLGVFNGCLLSAYLLFFNKSKRHSNKLLGGLILALTIRIGKSVVMYFNPDVHLSVLQLGLSACLFIGPLLYFYLYALKDNRDKSPSHWKSILLVLFLLIVIIGVIRPYHNYPEFWNTYCVQGIYLVWFFSLLFTSKLMFPLIKKCFYESRSVTSIEYWMLTIFFGNVIIASAFFTAFFGNSMAYYITGPLVFTLFIYLGAIGFSKEIFLEEDKKKKYAKKKISKEEAANLISSLNLLMDDQKIYIDPQLKLSDVANKLGVSPHILSQLLNDNLNTSFKGFINKHRIAEACKLLGYNLDLSIEGIGYQVGFKSKSTFFSSFKKIMNQTPSQYLQHSSASQT